MANLQERRDEMRERDEREMREREVKLTLTLPSNVRQGWGKGILIKYKYLNLTEESCCQLTPTCRQDLSSRMMLSHLRLVSW